MKPFRGIVAALVLLIAAGVYLYTQELCADCTGGKPGVPNQGTQAEPAPPGKSKPATAPPSAVATGAFDYYVLSLSWSPSFCESEGTERDKLQCGGRPFAFVVHGLWPQNEKGYPQDCPTDTPRVPDDLIQTLLDIMPSKGLIGHEWRSHGACTGMSQADYFAQVRAAFAAVAVPARFQGLAQALTIGPGDIAAAFLDANRGTLDAGELVVTCGGGTRLDEVRICMSKDLHFRACGSQTKSAACRRDQVRMPPVRGGG